MNVLVTGGCGFIGSNFIRYWLNKYPDDTVTNIDKLTYAGNLENTKDFADSPRYTFVHGDICDKALVHRETKGIDLIVHFAAETHVDRAISSAMEFVNTNLVGTYNLLDEAVKNNVGRFHHISTDEVFGALGLSEEREFDETWKHDPRNPYAATKAGAEDLVRSYFFTHQLPITITNCADNYGPYQSPEKFIPRIITNLINGDKVPVYGNGLNIRDWLYVEDHCRAIDLVIKKGEIGGTYLIGGVTKNVSNLDIAQKVIKLMGLGEDKIEFVKDRKGHDKKYAINSSKVRELGWKPEFDFDAQLEKTIEWYEKNEWWWLPLKEETERFYAKK